MDNARYYLLQPDISLDQLVHDYNKELIWGTGLETKYNL